MGAGFAYFYIYLSGPQLLQLFYIVIFTLAWVIGLFFLLPVHRLSLRLALSCFISLGLLAGVEFFSNGIWQNLFMALSLVWAGPVLVRKFHIQVRWASVVLLFCMLVDIYNILFATGGSSPSFSDETFFVNGAIVFHSALLGIGDFFLALLVVAFTQKKFGPRAALVLAFFIAVPRVVIRPLFNQLEGVTIPYYILIVPATLFFWWLLSRTKNLVRPERSGRNS